MRNEDEIKGKGKQAAGGARDKLGEVTRDPDLEAEGEAERAEGDVQEGFGKARRKVGESIKEAGDRISR